MKSLLGKVTENVKENFKHKYLITSSKHYYVLNLLYLFVCICHYKIYEYPYGIFLRV